MVTKRKLNVYFGFASYGGNGGISSEHPSVRKWFTQTVLKCKSDDRVGEITECTMCDTPVTMVRSRFVMDARRCGADVLVMVDSDQDLICHEGKPGCKPFWDSTFDYLYSHWDKGPVVIGCPYCGPPPISNMYVFFWENYSDLGDDRQLKLEQYPRAIAAQMRGIQECAALPTGAIMYDMRAFELIEPSRKTYGQILDSYKSGLLTHSQALHEIQCRSFFYYEWEEGSCGSVKCSTEDVQNTRDISLAGMAKLGYNPVLCNWDAPVGHWKPFCVPGRPSQYGVEEIAASFRKIVEQQTYGRSTIHDAARITSASLWDANVAAFGVQSLKGTASENGRPLDVITPQRHLSVLADLVSSLASGTPDDEWFEVAEIGSWKGRSALAMLKAHPRVRVHCIDTWQGSPNDMTGMLAKDEDVYEAFKECLQDYIDEGRVIPYKMDSLNAAEYFASDRMFNMVFLDADHSYEGVAADIRAWVPHLADDGVLIGHDWSTDIFPGLTTAVRDAFADNVEAFAWTMEDGGFWKVDAAVAKECLGLGLGARVS